jgi:hypothetical protein
MYTGGTNIPDWFCLRCKIKRKTKEVCECQCLLGGTSSSILQKKSTKKLSAESILHKPPTSSKEWEFCLAQTQTFQDCADTCYKLVCENNVVTAHPVMVT